MAVETRPQEAYAGIVYDLAWCYRHNATVEFRLVKNQPATVTITLPDGDSRTGDFRVAVEMLRRRHGD